MKRPRPLTVVVGVLTTATGLAATQAWADDAPAADDRALAERLRQLEERAAQVETLTTLVEELRGEVRSLRSQVERYEGSAVLPNAPPDSLPSQQPADMPDMRERQESLTHESQPFQPDLLRAAGEETGSGYGEGIEVTFWGWLTYLYRDDSERSTFWAWEVEMDVTKTFSERLAAAFDLDFVDTNDGADVNIEQLYLAALLSDKSETALTLGKFNAPFGIEARDFWDRKTGSLSLVWDVLPHDLTGVLLTQPLGSSGVTLQGFIVNGFDDNLDINRQPSLGAIVAWEPDPSMRIAATYYGGPETEDIVGDIQQLALGEATLLLTPTVAFSAEYVYGTSDTTAGSADWWGVASILNVDLDDRWRVFGRYSYLNDDDGFVTGAAEEQHEVGLGVALLLHPLVEVRTEYRHDFREVENDEDTVLAHISFGF